jgi:hypothetical protein
MAPTAEGWGLYAERLGKEMGFYQDPYSDFGRLSTEAWRAVRLVTDTGLHAKKWTREQAIDFFRENTLLSERDIVKEVERYLCNPGQATSYKIGELKIMALRAKAKAALGAKFDIRKPSTTPSCATAPFRWTCWSEQVEAWIVRRRADPPHAVGRGTMRSMVEGLRRTSRKARNSGRAVRVGAAPPPPAAVPLPASRGGWAVRVTPRRH